MQLKENLIKLFKQTCVNLDIPRQDNYIDVKFTTDLKKSIKNWFPKTIETEFDKYSFSVSEYDFDSYGRGFKFREDPPIIIASVDAQYYIKYGILIPVISYLFLNNYKRRNVILKQVDELTKKNPEEFKKSLCDSLEKKIWLKQTKYLIIHGSLIEELTFEEYNELKTRYSISVSNYDEHLLEKRLNIKE